MCQGTGRDVTLVYFLLAQSPAISQRWELSKFSGLSWDAHGPGHTHNPTDVLGTLDSQEYVTSFQRAIWTSHSSAFSFKFLVGFLFAPIVTRTLGNYVIKQLLLIALDKWLWGKYYLYCTSSLSGNTKISLPKMVYQGTARLVK